MLAIESQTRGVFNVVGPRRGARCTSRSRETGGTPLPLARDDRPAGDPAAVPLGLYPFPPRAMDFAKYQCTLDGTRFREATGFDAALSLAETFAAVARMTPR